MFCIPNILVRTQARSSLVSVPLQAQTTSMRFTLPLLSLALSGASARHPNRLCSNVSFEVPVISENVVFLFPPDPNNSSNIIHFLQEAWRGNFPVISGTTAVTDTYTIKGTYCEPDHFTPHKPRTLEVLVHGITYNRAMWSGFGRSEYNWHASATERGYATLALDRLGHGDSPERPDPLSVVQPQLHLEIIHHIISAVRRRPGQCGRNSQVNTLGTEFDKIVYVGHSLGSFLGAALAAKYPADADALVLTAYNAVHIDFSDVLAAKWVSAADLDPARFGAGLARGYVTLGKEEERTKAFFRGGYDPAIPKLDFKHEDTLTSGEIGALAALLSGGPAVEYKGLVMVATAVEDSFFCEEPAEKCEEHLVATGGWFPDAKSYDFFAPRNTGHDLTLHYSARDTFEKVHNWLDEKL
ncbi:hypothetical protein VTI74DRAFT_11000 [Chaetomium olivicolor]